MEETKKERPQDRWNKKNGLVAKSYRLKKDIVDAFTLACEKRGVSQSGQLTAMMQAFIDEVNAETCVNNN